VALAAAREDVPMPSFSLVRGGLVYDLQRRLGLIPPRGLGIARRALIFAVLAWAPMALLALFAGRFFPGEVAEPLVRHFAVHVRCLLVIPLFVAGEAVADGIVSRTVAQFVHSGVVDSRALRGFADVLKSAGHARDSRLGCLILVAAVALNMAFGASAGLDEVSWAVTEAAGQIRLLPGGWWSLLVVRPLASFLLGVWLWRLLVLWVLLRGIARLDLKLVATHPDELGGLGFLQGMPLALGAVVFAVSAVLASELAHDVLYHGLAVRELGWLLGVYVGLVVVVVLSPLLVFSPHLLRMRQAALREYGALLGRHGYLVHRRWIRGERTGQEDLLNAPEIGPVADAMTLYEAVEAARLVAVDRQTVVALGLAAALPMLPVIAIEVPLKDILLKLAAAIL